MSALFLDSSAWYAALSERQSEHLACRERYRAAIQRGTRLVTTSLVVAEMHALLLKRTSPAFAQRFLVVLSDAQHEVVHPDADLMEQATARWIRGYADQPFSLCDACSFEVMRTRRLKTAFTLDHRFAVAGFQTVP